MHCHDGNTPALPAHAAPIGAYLIPEAGYRQLQALHDDLRLLAHLSASASPDSTLDGLPTSALASNTQRAAQALSDILTNAHWQPQLG